MVEIQYRVCTPEQAVRLKQLGIKQISQWAWNDTKDSSDPWMLLYDDKAFPNTADWENDEYNYSAFDMTDLGIMLRSIGFYLSGATYELSSLPSENYKWWADDISTTSKSDDAPYQGYGATEVEARANLLIKLIEKDGKVPAQWEYFTRSRIDEMTRRMRKYGSRTDGSTDIV